MKTTAESLTNLVQRTASSLELNNHNLCIYTMGLVGEIGEAIHAFNDNDERGFYQELGDVVWYTVALSLVKCQNAPPDTFFALKTNSSTFNTEDCLYYLLEALYAGLDYMEKVKKYVRDYPERPLGSIDGYLRPLEILAVQFDLSDSARLLSQKLLQRYPNGFDAAASR